MALQERKDQGEANELDLTPMIDVVFLLLVFFMVATHMKVSNRALDAYLPKSTGTSNPTDDKQKNITIEINRSGMGIKIFVDNFPIDTFDGLSQKLRELSAIMNNDVPIVIAPSGNVPFEYVILSLNACSKAQIKKVSFAQPSLVQ